MVSSRLRVIVTGLVGLYPVGGVAWDYLQYLIGFARMGHDVYYHEDTWSWPYHPVERTYTADPGYSAAYIRDFVDAYAPELRDRWHYLHLHETSLGMTREAFDAVARSADLFLNVSGACMIPEELSPRCVKVFVDTDPGYNQIMLSERFEWSENVERWCSSVAAHDQHFTYAENIHGEDCIVPRLDFNWKTTRMPMVCDLWDPAGRAVPVESDPAWSTIMTWSAFKGKLIYNGVEYGSKGAEFERIIDLPRHVRQPLQVAVGGVNAPLERLAEAGWQVVDGPEATATPQDYQRFIFGSRGEISTAKQVYVAMRTGWFSCRTACYLAAGRPCVVQDTGFRSIVPCGEGIVAFSSAEEAIEGIERVERDYEHHCEAARKVANEHFGAERVLGELLDDAYSSEP
jgi:hypothetical protein